MPELNDDQPHVTFDCMLPTDGNCRAAVKNGDADLAILDSLDTYKAYKNDGLIAIAAEDEGEGDIEYYSVAIVKKDMCTSPNVSLASLKGKNACFTGYQRTAGWVVPVGVLLNSNVMPYISSNGNVQNDAESAAGFFDKVCAPRVANNGPTITAVCGVVAMSTFARVCTHTISTFPLAHSLSSLSHTRSSPYLLPLPLIPEWHWCQVG